MFLSPLDPLTTCTPAATPVVSAALYVVVNITLAGVNRDVLSVPGFVTALEDAVSMYYAQLGLDVPVASMSVGWAVNIQLPSPCTILVSCGLAKCLRGYTSAGMSLLVLCLRSATNQSRSGLVATSQCIFPLTTTLTSLQT